MQTMDLFRDVNPFHIAHFVPMAAGEYFIGAVLSYAQMRTGDAIPTDEEFGQAVLRLLDDLLPQVHLPVGKIREEWSSVAEAMAHTANRASDDE